MKTLTKKLLWLTIFSIAMGYLETAVVVYLRELYYPEGFRFPLTPIPPAIALTEFMREGATIIMLAGIAYLTGRNFYQRFACFLYSFAIWDLFYYLFLKVLLNWPESVFTWDILFLIPVPWVGPVLAPCLLSFTMILLAFSLILLEDIGFPVKIRLKEWMFLTTGSLVCIISFILDYLRFVQEHGGLSRLWTLTSTQSLFTESLQYVPQHYNWWLFGLGESLLLIGIYLFIRRTLSPLFPGKTRFASPSQVPKSDFADYFDAL